VTGLVGGNVAIISAATDTLVSAVESGLTNPFDIAATPDGTQLYVTNSGANTVSVIDSATNLVTSHITVGLYPHGVAVSPDGSRAYVANTGPDTGIDVSPGPGGSNTVSVIDVASGTVTATIDVGQAPRVIAISADGSTVYVSCRDGVHAIDAASGGVTGTIPLRGVQGIAVAPDGSAIYATLPAQNAVAMLDPFEHHRSLQFGHGRGLQTVPVGSLPWNVVFTLDGSAAYVTNANSDTVSVIDTQSRHVTATIPVGHIPTGITAEQSYVWVANNTSGSLSVIEIAGGSVTTIEIALADEPTAIALIS
jgi:phospholipase C